ncbi:MAG: AAA family ATPase [Myxococcota bacterium]
MKLHADQVRAVELICTAPIGIVTGGAGTGKTTCLRAALDRLEGEGRNVGLASPTGKAAKRITEATGREALTIHRLLKWTPMGFCYHQNNPLHEDVVIVDEASMVDIALMDRLLRAVQLPTRLVLMGDANQLPSVGAGKVLADLIRSERVPVVRLTKVQRSAAESWVCTQAPRVLEGREVDLTPRTDFRFIECSTEDLSETAAAAIEVRGGRSDIQVLVPQRTTDIGVAALNALLQTRLNDAERPAWKIGKRTLRVGDPVIHTVNDYELGVFNGETGTIIHVSKDVLVVDFEDREVEYARKTATALQLAYALTIHKSQGSEWPWVAVVCHSAHSYMLSRQLLYTALTRAREGVVLIGDRKGLARAIKNRAAEQRRTELVEQLQEGNE